MPTLVAFRFNSNLERVYNRLIGKRGYRRTVAAIMRKLVVRAKALLCKISFACQSSFDRNGYSMKLNLTSAYFATPS